jgi:hypothetical protein
MLAQLNKKNFVEKSFRITIFVKCLGEKYEPVKEKYLSS